MVRRAVLLFCLILSISAVRDDEPQNTAKSSIFMEHTQNYLATIHQRPKKVTFHDSILFGDTSLSPWLENILTTRTESSILNMMSIFSACMQGPDYLAECAEHRSLYPIITQSLIYGSIAKIWVNDIVDIFSRFVHLDPHNKFIKPRFAHHDPLKMIGLYMTNIWTPLETKISLYNGGHTPTISEYVVSECEKSADHTILLEWWWLQQYMFESAYSFYKIFLEWEADCEQWEIFLTELGITESARSGLHIYERTQNILHAISQSSILSSSRMYNIFDKQAPYNKRIPLLLQSGVPAWYIRYFCRTHSCKSYPQLASRLFYVDYHNHEALLTELAMIFNNDGPAYKMRYATKLAEACLQSDTTRMACTICGIYEPAIFHYMSQAKNIRDFHPKLSYLYDIDPPTLFAATDFNTYLIGMYKDLRMFFGLASDPDLEEWQNMDWDEDTIDFYIAYEGNQELSQLYFSNLDRNSPRRSVHKSWLKLLTTIQSYRTYWWNNVARAASLYDNWLILTDQVPYLYNDCFSGTLIEAANKLYATVTQSRIIQSNHLPISKILHAQVNYHGIKIQGNLLAITQIFEMLPKKRNRFGKKELFIPQQKQLPIPPSIDELLQKYGRSNSLSRLSRHSFVRRSFLSSLANYGSSTESRVSDGSPHINIQKKSNSVIGRLKKKLSRKFL